MLHRKTAVLSLKNRPINCCIGTKPLQLFHKHMFTNNRSWLIEQLQLIERTIAVICLDKQLRMMYWTSAVVAPNNYSSCTEQLQLFHWTIPRKVAVVSSNNYNYCIGQCIEQLQWFRWTTDRTFAVFATNSWNCCINMFPRNTAVDWANNCSCLGEQLQLFGRVTAIVWAKNRNYVGDHLQLFGRSTADASSNIRKSCSKQLRICTEYLQLLHSAIAIMLSDICSGLNQLPLFDQPSHWVSAVGSPNNGSCFVE